MVILLEDQRPRAHERHLAAKDVEELRQLVERVAPQEAAKGGDPRVVDDLEHPRVVLEVDVAVAEAVLQLLRVTSHRPELDDPEWLLLTAHPQLPEEDWAAGVQPDQNCDQNHQRPDQD